MLIRPDGDKDRHANTEFLRVEQGHALADDAGFLQPLNSAPAWGNRQADLTGNIGDRLGRIFLKML
jgi:hypothetical protein